MEDVKRGNNKATISSEGISWLTKRRNLQTDEIFEVPFGDVITTKSESCFRIGSINIRHFPFESTQPEKYDAMRNHLMTNEFDIIGMSEVGKNWTNIKDEQQMGTTLKRWWTQFLQAHSNFWKKGLPR